MKGVSEMTIYEIAKLAGTSVSTVSRVINRSAKVSPEVEKRVLDVMEQNNYTPNELARGLSLNKTNLIGVIIPGINSFFTKFLNGINEKCKAKGYNIIIATPSDYKKAYISERRSFDLLYSKRVDGILYFPTGITADYFKILEELAEKLPIVSVEREIEGVQTIPAVIQDNYEGSSKAVKYLISKGHKKIGFLKGPECFKTVSERYKAYIDTMKENGLIIEEEWIISGILSINSGYRSVKEIINSCRNLPTALLAANDNMAIGAMRALLEAGIKIPEEVAVMGFDNIEMGEYFYPSLTTVNQEHYAMGESAAELLIEYIENKKVSKRKIVMFQEIVERESV